MESRSRSFGSKPLAAWAIKVAGVACLLAALPVLGADASPTPTPASTRCIDPQQPGPWFRFLRADERFCIRPIQDDDPWWLALKNRGDGDQRWSVGGELRIRIENVDPVRAGIRGGRPDTYSFYRGLVHVDGHLSSQWRVFAELGYWNSTGREPGPSPLDVNRGDISQLAIDWTPRADTLVRVGRQQILLGSGRQLGFRGIPNIRQGFDGLRVGVPAFGGRLDAFHLRPVSNLPDSFNDREDSGERIAGAYWSRPGVFKELGIDAYAFRFEREFQRYQNGEGQDKRTVVGARLFGRRGRLTLNSELVFQDGRVGNQDARAWLFQSDTQWRYRQDSKWALGLKTSHGSGDDDPTDGRIETYQPIYAPPPYLMQSALFYPANLRTVQPYVEWVASPQLTLMLEMQGQWRVEKEDGYYPPPMVLTRLDNEGYFLGTQFGLTARYAPRRDLSLDATASRLQVAGPLQRAGAKDATYLAAMVTWSF